MPVHPNAAVSVRILQALGTNQGKEIKVSTTEWRKITAQALKEIRSSYTPKSEGTRLSATLKLFDKATKGLYKEQIKEFELNDMKEAIATRVAQLKARPSVGGSGGSGRYSSRS